MVVLLAAAPLSAQTAAEFRRQMESLLLDHRPALALEVGRRGLASAPGDPALQILTGALEIGLGDREEGLRMIRAGIHATEEPVLMQTAAEALSGAGLPDEAGDLWRRWGRAVPGAGEPVLRMAEQQFRSGDLASALETAAEAVRRDPGCLQCRKTSATLLGLVGRHEEALSHWYAAWRLNPDDPTLLRHAAAAEIRRGRRGQALELLELAAEMDPENPLYPREVARLWSEPAPGWTPDEEEAARWGRRYRLLERAFETLSRAVDAAARGHREEAIADLRAVLREVPEFATGAAYLGHLLEASGRREEARDYFARALGMRPSWNGVREAAAWLDLEAGRVDAAVDLLASGRRFTPNLLLFEAHRRQLAGEWQVAVELLRRFEELYPLDVRALRLIAHALHRLGQPAEALVYLEKAYRLEADPEVLKEARRIRYEDALQKESAGAWEAAERALGRLVAEEDLPEYRLRWAYSLQNLGRYPEAIDAYRKGLSETPGEDWARSNLAWCYFVLGDYESAAEAWSDSVARMRRPADLFNLGLTRLRQYRDVEGWKLVREAAEFGYPPARDLLASASERALRR